MWKEKSTENLGIIMFALGMALLFTSLVGTAYNSKGVYYPYLVMSVPIIALGVVFVFVWLLARGKALKRENRNKGSEKEK